MGFSRQEYWSGAPLPSFFPLPLGFLGPAEPSRSPVPQQWMREECALPLSPLPSASLGQTVSHAPAAMLRVLFFLLSWENTKEEGCCWQPHHRETWWPAAISTLSPPTGTTWDYVFWLHDVWLSCQRSRLGLESPSHEKETTRSSFPGAPLLTPPVPSAPPLSSLRLQAPQAPGM